MLQAPKSFFSAIQRTTIKAKEGTQSNIYNCYKGHNKPKMCEGGLFCTAESARLGSGESGHLT